MNEQIEPCEICEDFIKGVICNQVKCPVAQMKAENKKLKEENRKLKLEMSYMVKPNTIGETHEMGAW